MTDAGKKKHFIEQEWTCIDESDIIKHYLCLHLDRLSDIKLGDEPGSKLALRPFGSPLFSLSSISARYAHAINSPIIQLRRHEKSLMARSELLGEMGK